MRTMGRYVTPQENSEGATTYGGLIDVGDERKISVYICIFEDSKYIFNMKVELKWVDDSDEGTELTDQEYDELVTIVIGEMEYETSIISYAIREILSERREGADNVIPMGS